MTSSTACSDYLVQRIGASLESGRQHPSHQWRKLFQQLTDTNRQLAASARSSGGLDRLKLTTGLALFAVSISSCTAVANGPVKNGGYFSSPGRRVRIRSPSARFGVPGEFIDILVLRDLITTGFRPGGATSRFPKSLWVDVRALG